jgi:hypothetical protein
MRCTALVLTRQHGLAELEHIVTGHIQHRAFDVLESRFSDWVQQGEFLNFLVGCQQIALTRSAKTAKLRCPSSPARTRCCC